MKILIVAPGPVHSTYDIYRYYLDALKQHDDVEVHGFDFHNHLIYHKYAVDQMFPHYSDEDKRIIYTINSTRSLLYETIVYKPDFVFVVSGTMIPHEIYRELLNIRRENNMKFGLALYLTECPYVDHLQEQFIKYSDVLFVNDKYSVDVYDPDRSHYIDYLPHSYNPKVHYDGSMNGHVYKPEHSSDVLFCGTAFVERVDMIASVNWDGVDFKIIGDKETWLYENGKVLEPYIEDKIVMNNWELANYYRGTKIALNIHRTRSGLDENDTPLDNYNDAYSIGPRLYEAAACGAFILTDYRQEAIDIFGDTIDYFDTPQEMEEKIRYWLHPDNEQERVKKANAAMERIKNCTFSDRLDEYILPVFNDVISLRRG